MNATKWAKSIEAELVSRSVEQGGAWIAVRSGAFSSTIEYRRFASPCRVPDCLQDFCLPVLSRYRVGYKGKLVNFTLAAIIREQNRGIGCS